MREHPIEHFEIASYKAVRSYAHKLGFEQVARLLEETLEDEIQMDEKLNALEQNHFKANQLSQVEGKLVK